MLFRGIFARLTAIFSLVGFVNGIDHNPDYPLQVSENGRYFETADGKPFLWQADTAWALFHRLNITEATTYLDDRASKGFNMLLAVALIQFGPTDKNRAGDIPFDDLDLTKPNEAYWQYVDQVYQLAWDRGIRIAMVPAWGYYWHESDNTVGFDNVSITADNGYAFGQWFGSRYPDSPYILMADTNPIWTNKTAVSSNYALGGIQPDYSFTNYLPVLDAVATGLQAGSGKGNDAMITLHPTNQWFSGTPVAVASAFADDRDWLTFDACQSGHADYAPNPPIPWWNARRGYEPVAIMYANSKARPVLDNEAHYEHRYDNGKAAKPYWNDTDVRRGSFQAVFSGAAGFTYGAEMVMQFYVPGVYDPASSGPAVSWAEEIHLPGSSQVVNIGKLLNARKAYPYFVPDSSMLKGDLGRDDNKTMALRAEDSSALLVYDPTGSPIVVDISCLPSSYQASWFDPIDGSYTAFDKSQAVYNGSVATFTTLKNATHDDWVLVLEA